MPNSSRQKPQSFNAQGVPVRDVSHAISLPFIGLAASGAVYKRHLAATDVQAMSSKTSAPGKVLH